MSCVHDSHFLRNYGTEDPLFWSNLKVCAQKVSLKGLLRDSEAVSVLLSVRNSVQ